MVDRPARRERVHWIEIDGDVVVVDPTNDGIHVLSGAAAVVWQLIDGEPIDGMADLLAEHFGIDFADAGAGLIDALVQLERADVIVDNA